MADDSTDLGEALYKRAMTLHGERTSVFDSQWQILSQYNWPDVSDINTQKTESTTGWFDRIYDSTAIRSAATCSIGVRNWVTPSTDPWLSLSPPGNLPGAVQKTGNARIDRLMPMSDNDEAMDEATRWLAQEAEDFLHDLSSSNFYSTIQPFNRGACVFGTALLFMEEGKAETFKFEQFKVGTFVIAENDQKIVDTVVRWFKLTVRQAKQKFGAENLPKKMQQDLAEKRFDTKYVFLHHCFPNEDFRAGALGREGMAFASVYQAEVDKTIVSQGGYEEMPYFCLRWTRWGTDDQAYGCSPAFETLVEARQLNFVTQFKDALVELKAFPRFITPDSLDGEIKLAAGAETIVDGDDMARGVMPKEWMTQGDLTDTDNMIAEKKKAIEEAFFVDIFRMFDQLEGKQQRTAYEIAQRLGEKLDKFTGTFDQYVTELINPLVRRGIGIRMRAGKSRPAPESLLVVPENDPKAPPQLAVPKIQIKSRVTLAIKALRNAALQNMISTWAPVLEAHPELWDNVSGDSAFRNSGRNFGIDEKDFRPMKQVIDIRDARAQQMQEERAAELAQKMGGTVADLGKAPQPIQQAVISQFPHAKSG